MRQLNILYINECRFNNMGQRRRNELLISEFAANARAEAAHVIVRAPLSSSEVG